METHVGDFYEEIAMNTCIAYITFGDSDRFNAQSWTLESKHSSIDSTVLWEQLTTAQLVSQNPMIHCCFHKSSPLVSVSLPVSLYSFSVAQVVPKKLSEAEEDLWQLYLVTFCGKLSLMP
jgi:hypothetical protein